MSAAAAREPRGDLPEHLGAELRRAYDRLPHRSARWRTKSGQDFLTALEQARSQYKLRSIADALGVSVQGIGYMLERRRLRRPVDWPEDEDLRALRAAWRVVAAASTAGQVVRRQDPEFIPVHQALRDLLTRFEGADIALAMGIEPRRLARFVHPPLQSAWIAAHLGQVLPPQRFSRSWQER